MLIQRVLGAAPMYCGLLDLHTVCQGGATQRRHKASSPSQAPHKVCLMFCIVTVSLVVAQQGRAMRPVLVVMWSDRCFLPPTHWPSSIRSHHRDVVHPPTYIGCCARGVRALTCMAQGTSDAHKHRIIRDTSNSNTSLSEQDRSANVGRLNFTSVASSPQYTCTCELTILITCMHIYLLCNN